jgi:ATP-dependent RNA helicase DDX1
MNAFETELGVEPELARAVDEMGWLLPTDVQSEAIPMILGGGDVLMVRRSRGKEQNDENSLEI